jgi:hypothetical protein
LTGYATEDYVDGNAPAQVELHMEEGYKLSVTITNGNGNTLSSSVIDLPIESLVSKGEYNNETKKLILTLQNGDVIEISVEDLISGLATTEYVDGKIDGLAGVATSGSYNDLKDLPEIPSIEGLVNEQTLNDRIGDIGEFENIADYVANTVAEVDVSEQLGDLGVNVDEEGQETPKTVKQYVDESIEGLATEGFVDEKLKQLSYNDINDTPEIPSIDGLVHEDRLGEIPTDKTVAEYVDEAVAAIDVSE